MADKPWFSGKVGQPSITVGLQHEYQTTVNRVLQDEFYLVVRSVDGGSTYNAYNHAALLYVELNGELPLGEDWEVAVSKVDHPGAKSGQTGKLGLAYLLCDFVQGPEWTKGKLYFASSFTAYLLDTFRVGSAWEQYVANPRTYRPICYEKLDGLLKFIICKFNGQTFDFESSGSGILRSDLTTIELHFRKRKPLYTPGHGAC